MFEESVPSIWASVNSWFTPTVLFLFLNLMIGTIAIASSLGTQKHNHHHQQDPHPHAHPPLARSSSMLQRLKSINFYPYRSHEPAYDKTPEIDSHYIFKPTYEVHEPQQIARSPSMLERLKSLNFYNYISHESTNPQFSSPNLHKTQELPQNRHNFKEPVGGEDDEGEDGEAQDQFQAPSLDEIYSRVSRSKSDPKPSSVQAPTRLTRKMKKSASSKTASRHSEEYESVETRRPATMKEGNGKVTEVDDEVDAKADDFINRFKQQLKLQRLESIVRYKEMIGRGSGR